MKRILVVNVNWLGDAIMTTPAFKAIKEKFPSSFVAVTAPERVKEVFSDNPHIDEVIIFDEKKNQKAFSQKLRFIQQLRAKKFDTAFLIHRSFTRALICLLSGIKVRIGYRRLKNIFIVNKMINPPAKNIHKQDYYLYLFEKAAIAIADKLPKVYIQQQIQEKYKADISIIRQKHTYLVGVNPSANWLLKQWPQENFAILCDKLIRELNCGILFIGAKIDTAIVDGVINKMVGDAYNFCAKTNIKELAAIIKNVDLFISNDSGPAHLSASLGVNTLVLFGPTSSKLSAPRGKAVQILEKSIHCEIPCYSTSCQDNLCIKNITVEDAYIKAKEFLKNV
ncbi:MAG: lipopolysaccharide heptosyltransferase II [Candidatus Omnitrophica bacterium]|jgi:ADP-heptose:LPS heptosyltransferase|nr:lipopolysaccharide heptosyltransferase II [Candidatus Omnitrophota bacterium]